MLALIAALLAVAPTYLDKATAYQNVRAALAASRETGVDVKLLLAIGYIESRYNPNALSRCEGAVGSGCGRVYGPWLGNDPPSKARPSWYCGIMQVGGDVSWARCQHLRADLDENYMAGAKHLIWWSNVPECRDKPKDERLNCALQGYNGGYPAINTNYRRYVNMVMWMVGKIRYVLPREPSPAV